MSMARIHHAGAVDDYVESHLLPQDRALLNAYENSTKNGLRPIAVTPSQGKFLLLLATMNRSKFVLEVGTLGGYSTICFARAVKCLGGKVVSIEINDHNRLVAIDNLRFAGIKVPEEVEVVLGDALEVLPKLHEEIAKGTRQPFDFFFADGPWETQAELFDWGIKCSKKGSVLYVDNVVRNILESGFVGSEKRDQSILSLVEEVGKDDRVEATVLQTVGSKDYDGYLMAVVK